VAVTRAKNELALLYPLLARDRYGVDVILDPSEFLRELPESVTERWTVELETEEAPARAAAAAADDDDVPPEPEGTVN
jgi:superfamily I DNA/RNA helicase